MRKLMTAVLCFAMAAPLVAMAGGYDTPILYSARHIGKGGTGISSVDDPTALFMNPAGLAHTKFISLTANFSPILAKVTASPCFLGNCVQDQTTDTAFSPAFLLGASFRVTDFLTLGIGAYPLAAAGAEYPDYRTTQSGGGLVTKDRTAITFIEVSPGLAFHGKRWSLGFGYRITIASLQRSQIIGLDSGVEFNNFELDLAGIDFKGLRIGFQFQPVDGLDIGFVYRHKIQPILKGDTATFLNKSRGKTEMDVTLPSRLGLGIRGEIPLKEGMYIAVETDIEYAFQSQNEFSDIDTTKDDGSVETIKSFFNWQDALTLRLGLEVGVIEHLRLRAGYVFDEQVTNKSYASAFGTPPADTHTGTFGAGWDQGPWEVNVAYAYRSGSYDVNIDDIQARTDQSRGIGGTCLTCSGEGTHEIDLHGFYLDFSYNWE